ncbi:hypothetical protein HK099_007422 [Clydaea vesicula]|uniref:Uncharacterized protein n=1 Tax=Clydaea vesicula TaxID=447962 RepID=A0AAD5TYN3_9FUNG|nr:hypothetical protein HK099_007422 [Clydaea vesicula]
MSSLKLLNSTSNLIIRRNLQSSSNKILKPPHSSSPFSPNKLKWTLSQDLALIDLTLDKSKQNELDYFIEQNNITRFDLNERLKFLQGNSTILQEIPGSALMINKPTIDSKILKFENRINGKFLVFKEKVNAIIPKLKTTMEVRSFKKMESFLSDISIKQHHTNALTPNDMESDSLIQNHNIGNLFWVEGRWLKEETEMLLNALKVEIENKFSLNGRTKRLNNIIYWRKKDSVRKKIYQLLKKNPYLREKLFRNNTTDFEKPILKFPLEQNDFKANSVIDNISFKKPRTVISSEVTKETNEKLNDTFIGSEANEFVTDEFIKLSDQAEAEKAAPGFDNFNRDVNYTRRENYKKSNDYFSYFNFDYFFTRIVGVDNQKIVLNEKQDIKLSKDGQILKLNLGKLILNTLHDFFFLKHQQSKKQDMEKYKNKKKKENTGLIKLLRIVESKQNVSVNDSLSLFDEEYSSYTATDSINLDTVSVDNVFIEDSISVETVDLKDTFPYEAPAFTATNESFFAEDKEVYENELINKIEVNSNQGEMEILNNSNLESIKSIIEDESTSAKPNFSTIGLPLDKDTIDHEWESFRILHLGIPENILRAEYEWRRAGGEPGSLYNDYEDEGEVYY